MRNEIIKALVVWGKYMPDVTGFWEAGRIVLQMSCHHWRKRLMNGQPKRKKDFVFVTVSLMWIFMMILAKPLTLISRV